MQPNILNSDVEELVKEFPDDQVLLKAIDQEFLNFYESLSSEYSNDVKMKLRSAFRAGFYVRDKSTQ